MITSIATLITDIQATIRPYLELQMAAKKELVMAFPVAMKEVEAMDFSEKLSAFAEDAPHRQRLALKVMKESALEDKGYSASLIKGYCNIKEDALDKKLAKDLESSLGKIKVAVTKKVKDSGTVETIKNKYIDNQSQFVEGAWLLTHTDGTTKTLTIESILAGGHSIQCLHIRTLYKYK